MTFGPMQHRYLNHQEFLRRKSDFPEAKFCHGGRHMHVLGRIPWLGFYVAAAVSHAAPGDLDVTFAGTGVSRIGFGGATDTGQAVALQADGKLVVAGHSQRAEGGTSVFIFSIVRYLPDGSLDPSFGGDGRVFTELGLGAIALSVKVQVDGKIVVAGQRLITGDDFGDGRGALQQRRLARHFFRWRRDRHYHALPPPD